MNRIFDIHNHILWGVDDGSRDLDMSIRMLRMAVDSGTTDIILTPHNKPNRRNIYTSEINDMIAQLREVCQKEGIDINFYPGNEIYYRTDAGDRIDIGKATTMAGSHYVLLEFSPLDDWSYIRKGAEDMLLRGYYPIIAHVERYMNVVSSMDRVKELCDKGCYLQVNAGSIMGDFGFGAKRFTRKLLKENLISFIASDSHEDKRRTPDMSKCIAFVVKKCGEDTAQRIFETNPGRIIEDKFI